MDKCCRICGSEGLTSEYRNITSFEGILKRVYDVDIAAEDASVYPKIICGSCRQKVTKYNQNLQHRGKAKKVELPSTLASFEKESARPRKRLKFAGSEDVVDDASLATPFSYLEETVDTEADHDNLESDMTAELTAIPDKENWTSVRPPHSLEAPVALSIALESPVKPGTSSEAEGQQEPHAIAISKSADVLQQPSTPTFEMQLFKDQYVAEILSCVICKRLSSSPDITPCHHICCKMCIERSLTMASSCPKCSSALQQSDMSEVTGYIRNILKHLLLKCPECDYESSLENVTKHWLTCKPSAKTEMPAIHRSKTPLSHTSMKYLKYRRLKDLISSVADSVNGSCLKQFEDETDVYFALLAAHLDTKKDDRLEKVLEIWKGQEDAPTTLSPDVCLALRVDSLQSKSQYSKQFDFFKQMGSNPYATLYEVNQVEKKYLPGNVRYGIQGDESHTSLYHTPAKISEKKVMEPIDIMLDFTSKNPESFTPNVCGVRWSYQDCISKTLEELNPMIEANMKDLGISHQPDMIYKVYVKDGCDGMGDVSVYKALGDRGLPDKAFRTSFCILKILAKYKDQEYVVFEEEQPNSVRTNRPLIEAVCDENDSPSSLVCILPVEYERKFLTGKILSVECDKISKRFEVDFYCTMIDEKLDRAESGLAGSGSSYVCTLCYATREAARSQVGQFKIERTYKGTMEVAEYITKNPDKLPQAKLDKLAKGVKAMPILFMDAAKKGVDATHTDINLGRFFKNFIAREIAQVTSWSLTADIKDLVVHAEKRFDRHIKSKIGLNAQLMMPGNYARVMFDPRNIDTVVELIPNIDTKQKMKELLTTFSEMRKIYRANKPLVDYPEDVKNYKKMAVKFGESIRDNFPYVSWPNYLHKVIEHVQELIERPDGPGTVGGMSGEGNEAGNKVFRHFRKNLARKGATYDSLRDVLLLHWLYSSPSLGRLAAIERAKKTCSLCSQEGHNIRTCLRRTVHQ